MSSLQDFSIKAKYFKCFGEKEQGFETIKPINLIIGRNNSGKSSLLDLIEHTINNNPSSIPETLWHNSIRPQFIARSPLSEQELRPVFRENVNTQFIPGANDWHFGQRLVGTSFQWDILGNQGKKYLSIDRLSDGTGAFDNIQHGKTLLNSIADHKINPLSNKIFRRISAERDIIPEADNNSLEVSGSGDGATNIIQHFINKAHLSSELVEKTLLTDLNKIFKTDAYFTDIVCQQFENHNWEIFLEEDKKGRVALSESGSGLKTIILILIFIHLVPVVMKKDLTSFIFGLEELENNLHPALLRRLLLFLQSKALKDNCILFFTTHSNVQIDLFSKNESSQIVHVTHTDFTSTINTVKTYIDNRGVLDDLDIRASDLLQSNGIIWVEGPSDRIYVNKWIEIWSRGELQEGAHYQCIFYGGRLLSHLSSNEAECVDDGVSILNINRNSIILIDSDKRNQQSRLNDTKKRIVSEFDEIGGIAWVTKGKEIENYIPYSAVKELLNLDNDADEVGLYENFFDYLDSFSDRAGTNYARKKPLLAEHICQLLTYDNSSNILDLNDRMNEVCQRIKSWNSMQ